MMSEDDEVTIEGINTLNVIPRLLTAGRYLFILVCVCVPAYPKYFAVQLCVSYMLIFCHTALDLCVAPNGKNSSTF